LIRAAPLGRLGLGAGVPRAAFAAGMFGVGVFLFGFVVCGFSRRLVAANSALGWLRAGPLGRDPVPVVDDGGILFDEN
jgi:hypothetical protein